MIVGHLAVGLAAKRLSPRTSLGWLLAAPLLVDLLWSLLVLVGLERTLIVPGITRAMPLDLEYVGISHSLATTLLWAILFAGAHLARHRDARAAMVLAFGVLTHFVLDWVTHRPDMPLLPAGPHVGLGLWNYPTAAILVEAGMVGASLLLYLPTLPAGSSRQTRTTAGIMVFLVAMTAGNYFGPPPPSIELLATGNLLLCGVVWWLARLDARPRPHVA
jgi:membrane-bound metal-dependent hydrolase YbcI (DUF457 family)